MNPMVTSFIAKLGEAVLSEGIQGVKNAATQKNSRGKKGGSDKEDLSSFANILAGTAAKTMSQKKVAGGKAAGSSNPAGELREGLAGTQRLEGAKAFVREAASESLKGEEKARTLASVSESLKTEAADAGSRRFRKSQLQSAVRAGAAEEKFDASGALLNRIQGVKTPKSSRAGVSEFSQQRGKIDKGALSADRTQAREAGASRGQKRTEAGRPEAHRSDAANIKDRAEGAKAPVNEGRASATDGVNRQEDHFANVSQARTGSATGRVSENTGPLRPQVIIPQVVEGASHLLRSGSGRVTITLHPPQLGTIDMDIQVRDNKVSMLMLADNHEVKQVLESSLTHLRNALSEQGLQVDRVDVLVQDRSGNEFAGLLHERGSSAEGRGQVGGGGQSGPGAEAGPDELRRSMDADESRLVNIFA